MKKQFLKLSVVALVVAMFFGGLFSSCGNKYKTDDSGLRYKFFNQNDTGAVAQVGDLVHINFVIHNTDSTFLENMTYIQINEPLYEGDMLTALMMMHVGDSASFIFDADTFFHYFMGAPYELEDKELYFDVKLVDLLPKAEYEEMMMQRQQQVDAMIEELRVSEDSILKAYIDANNIKVKPTASGLYVIPGKKGTGPNAAAGDKVTVHYTGMTTDGNVFDSSVERNEPFEVTIGQNSVIQGWEEGLTHLNAGSTAKFVIPSSLAYGERGAGNIPPYTPLVFDVEVLSITK